MLGTITDGDIRRMLLSGMNLDEKITNLPKAESVTINSQKKDDIIFWKGHVALAISSKRLIHAYGPMKKVVIMDINRTIERIERTANLKVTSIRRY